MASPLPAIRRLLVPTLRVRPVRFLLVGLTGIGVNSLVLWLATGVGTLATPVGGALAAVVSTFTNFLLNDAFTWSDRRSRGWRAKGKRLLRYYATTGLGNLIYLGTLTVLTRIPLPLLGANMLAIGVGGGFNYLVHNVWTWQRTAGRRDGLARTAEGR
ncbi:MAG: GtrA family protein [Armatimonadota bacterium]|nr:GtrA family protein [Armatimonadota bacterium]MDR7447699.1 GtrA family protein [Armatimonadota bacterium]MDR7459034.1 GtrA family protein [Armatimonadota bacterium]MDR7480135.1 GtrA family protein [Armatimonadota bacterium]MDR7488888.1 GtrA family protein [Armatimonadota bacterium]